MRRTFLCLTILLIGASIAAADVVTVTSTTGRVETRIGAGTWQTASSGTTIPIGADISTGFNSRATLDINGNLVHVDPLTRVAVSSFAQEGNVTSTELNLRVGRVTAEVRTAEGLSQEFRLRSTQSTASVRGTVFVYDGFDLQVDEGRVELSNRIAQQRTVVTGQESTTDEFVPPARGDKVLIRRTVITADPVDASTETKIEREPLVRPTTGTIRAYVR
jgi:hypothetical protein